MPSESTLRSHKNFVPQISGLQEETILWMKQQADLVQLSPHGCCSGLALDETSIQPGLEMVRNGHGLDLVGFVDMGPEGDAMEQVRKGNMS